MTTHKTVTCTVDPCPKGYGEKKVCPVLKLLAKSCMAGTFGKCAHK